MTKLLKDNPCDFFVSLWFIYYVQESIGIEGILSQLIFAILLLWSILYFFLTNSTCRLNSFLRGLNFLLAVFTIYGIILILSRRGTICGSTEIPSYYFLKNIYMSFMPLYPVYYWKVHNKIKDNRLFVYLLSFYISYIAIFFVNATKITLETGAEGATNNAGYYFLPLIPMLQLIKCKNIIKHLMMLLIVLFVFLSMKRGAMLIGVVVILLYLKKNLWADLKKHFIISSVLFVLAGYFIYNGVIGFYNDNEYMQLRVEQTLNGSTSGRDVLYEDFYKHITEDSSFLDLLVGNGADSSILIVGNYAHNDWLEIMINMGLVGILTYLIYWLSFIAVILKDRRKIVSDYNYVLTSLLVIFFMSSLFSMSIANIKIAASFVLGFTMACKSLVKGNQSVKKINEVIK